MQELNPENFGLNKRTVLIEISPHIYGIMKKRKSRIIMKDAKQILEIAQKIWMSQSDIQVKLLTNAPVCSKSIAFLEEQQIEVEAIKDSFYPKPFQ